MIAIARRLSRTCQSSQAVSAAPHARPVTLRITHAAPINTATTAVARKAFPRPPSPRHARDAHTPHSTAPVMAQAHEACESRPIV